MSQNKPIVKAATPLLLYAPPAVAEPNLVDIKGDIQEREFFIVGSMIDQFGTNSTHSMSELEDIYKNPTKTLLSVPSSYIPTSIIISEKEFKMELPCELKNIAEEIEYSKYILTLKEDYDDNGGMPIPQQTWERAVRFLSNYSQYLYSNLGIIISAPSIMPSTEKDILMIWKTKHFQLLLTIPFDSKNPITYYGDNNSEDDIKGKLNDKKIQSYFALWLANMSNND